MTQGEVFNVTALGLAYDRHPQRIIKDVTMTNKLSQFDNKRASRQNARQISDHTIVRTAETAAILSITKKHLSELSKRDDFPRKVRLGQQAIGWRIQDIEAWIDSKMVNSAHVDGGQNDTE